MPVRRRHERRRSLTQLEVMPTNPLRGALASLEQVYVADRAEWRRWLAAHHATSPGI